MEARQVNWSRSLNFLVDDPVSWVVDQTSKTLHRNSYRIDGNFAVRARILGAFRSPKVFLNYLFLEPQFDNQNWWKGVEAMG